MKKKADSRANGLIEKIISRTVVDPETGCWNWRGTRNSLGYGSVRVDGEHLYLHRWSYEFFRDLLDESEGIDHICRNSSCFNPAHLRPANQSQNIAAAVFQASRTSRFRGVCLKPETNKWRSYICVNGKQFYLGLFKNEIDAAKAYDTAARKFFGEFAFQNFPTEAA